MKTKIKRNICLFLILSLVLIGCKNVKRDWEKTKVSNSIEDAKKFLKENPNCEFTAQAKLYLDSLEWSDAISSNDPSKVSLFLKRFKINSVNSLKIYSSGEEFVFGTFAGSERVPPDGHWSFFGGGPVLIEIYRDLMGLDTKFIETHKIHTGFAYISNNNSVVAILKIDLKKSNNDYNKLFKIESGIQTISVHF
jgi:hypothetical protein